MIVAECSAEAIPHESRTAALHALGAAAPTPDAGIVSPISDPVPIPAKLAEDEELDEEEEDVSVGGGEEPAGAPEAPPGFGDELDDDIDDFDDIDEDDFDDDFDDDFEEELDDDYEIEIDDEISAEFGLGSGDDEESVADDLDEFEDFDEV